MARSSNAYISYVEPNYTNSYVRINTNGVEELHDMQIPLEDYCIVCDLEVEVPGREYNASQDSGKHTIKVHWTSSPDKGEEVTLLQGTRFGKPGSSVNYLTTSYTDIFLDDIKQSTNEFDRTNGSNEMFGIESVNITYKSWTTPEVDIVFKDVRAAAVFALQEQSHSTVNQCGTTNQQACEREDVAGSFFKCFFQFPYPKFKLTVKGFYGNAVCYVLNCTDFRQSFDSNSGNFTCKAHFIAYDYALLNDVTINAALIAPDCEAFGAEYWANKHFVLSDGKTPMPKMSEILRKAKNLQTILTEVTENSETAIAIKNAESSVLLFNEITDAWDKYNKSFSQSLISYTTKSMSNIHTVMTSSQGTGFIVFVFDGQDIDNSVEVKEITSNSIAPNVNYSSNYGAMTYNGIPMTKDLGKSEYSALEDKINEYTRGYSSGVKIVLPPPVDNAQCVRIVSKDGKPMPYVKNNSSNHFINALEEVMPPNDLYNLCKNNGANYALIYDVTAFQKSLEDYTAKVGNGKNEQQENLNKEVQKALATSIGFDFTVKNVTMILWAHLETFFHCVFETARLVSAKNRKVSDLMLDMRNVNVNSKDADPLLPPFPTLTDSTWDENGVEHKTKKWMGSFPGGADEPEVYLIESLLSAVNEFEKVAQSAEHSIENKGTFFVDKPTSPVDLVADSSVFGNIDFDSIPDVLGHIYGRMLSHKATVYDQTFEDDDWNDDDIGSRDAEVFYKLNQSVSSLWRDYVQGNNFTKNNFWSILKTNTNNIWSDIVDGAKNIDDVFSTDENTLIPLQNWDWNDVKKYRKKNLKTNVGEDFLTAYSDEKTLSELAVVIDTNNLGKYDELGEGIKLKNIYEDSFKWNKTRWYNPKTKDFNEIEDVSNYNTVEGKIESNDYILAYYNNFENGKCNYQSKGNEFKDNDYQLPFWKQDFFKKLNSQSGDGSYPMQALIFLHSMGFDVNSDKSFWSSNDLFNSNGVRIMPYGLALYIGGCMWFIDELGKRRVNANVYDTLKQSGKYSHLAFLFGDNGVFDCKTFGNDLSNNMDISRFGYQRADVRHCLKKIFLNWANGSTFRNWADTLSLAEQGGEHYDSNWYNNGSDINHAISVFVMRPCAMIILPKGERTQGGDMSNPTKGLIRLTDNEEGNNYLGGFISRLKEIYGEAGNIQVTPPSGFDTDVNIKLALYDYISVLYNRWLFNTTIDDWTVERMFRKDPAHFHFMDSYYNKIDNVININIVKFNELVLASRTQETKTFYSFISELYAQNNMQLLFLQAFLNMCGAESEENMKVMFKPVPYNEIKKIDEQPHMVCLFGGQYSEHLDLGDESQFEDDGFMLTEESKLPLAIKTKSTNCHYKIPAFGVSYGRMYQSYFTEIEVNSEQPQLTEQAIKAQMQIAGVNSEENGEKNGHITAVGQDIYTVYSNNAYSCTVKMMGCAWVSPLMYFQLNNIPMFRGAYMITSVTHSIVAGNMVTTIGGVRMAKNSTPYVNSYLFDADGESLMNRISEGTVASVDNNCAYEVFSPLGGSGEAIDINKPVQSVAQRLSDPIYRGKTIADVLEAAAYGAAGDYDDLSIQICATVYYNQYHFYKGNWNEVFHPSRIECATPLAKEYLSGKGNHARMKKLVGQVFQESPSCIVGKVTQVTKQVPIYENGRITSNRTKSAPITLRNVQRILYYASPFYYQHNGNNVYIDGGEYTAEAQRNNPNCIFINKKYGFQHELNPSKKLGHIYLEEDRDLWKVKEKPKKGNPQKELALGLIKAIKQTAEVSDVVDANFTYNDITGNTIDITGGTNLANIFDICLNGYYDYIKVLSWRTTSNQLKNPNPNSIHIICGYPNTIKDRSIGISINNNSFFTIPLEQKDVCSDNFYKSLSKKYMPLSNEKQYYKFLKENKSFSMFGAKELENVNKLFMNYNVVDCENLIYAGDALYANQISTGRFVPPIKSDGSTLNQEGIKYFASVGKPVYTTDKNNKDVINKNYYPYQTSYKITLGNVNKLGRCTPTVAGIISYGGGIKWDGKVGSGWGMCEEIRKHGFAKLPFSTESLNTMAKMDEWTKRHAKIGDVCIYKKPTDSRAVGHACIYNGRNWVSDFIQNNALVYGDKTYTDVAIYRHDSMVNKYGTA